MTERDMSEMVSGYRTVLRHGSIILMLKVTYFDTVVVDDIV